MLYIFSIFMLVLVVGCSKQNQKSEPKEHVKKVSEYQKCLDDYEKLKEKNGGNGGFVGPEYACQGKSKDK
jgi:hypothetical protein